MKHAYLILAHDNPKVLDRLIKELTHPDIKIFIHLDKKCLFDGGGFISSHKSNNVIFIRRKRLRWGDYSLVDATLRLIETANKESFDYYHLISGTTLPIKRIEDILDFYSINKGKEFVVFIPSPASLEDRWLKYHIIQRHNLKVFHVIQKILNKKKKNPPSYAVKFGSQWFSITGNFANYLLSKKIWIKKNFKFVSICDELFLQTVLYNSEFKYKLFYLDGKLEFSNMLYLDWADIFKTGERMPIVLKKQYLPILKNSKLLFARKFNDESFEIFYDLIR